VGGAAKVCPCGRPIVHEPGETLRRFERRLISGYCRSKCKRKHHTYPPAKRGFGIEVPTDKAVPRISEGFRRNFLEAAPRQFSGSFFKVIPVDDPRYLKWIRTQPCMIPGCRNKAESHHENPEGDSAMGGKCSDRRALPLCICHHTGGGTTALPGSYHGLVKLTGRAFLKHYGIDSEKKILQFNAEYDQLKIEKNRRVHSEATQC